MTTTAATGPGGLTEGDIAAILTAANDGEVEQGRVASTRATRDDVRSFGQMMVTDHSAANQRASETFARLGITPTENETSRTLRENSRISVQNLGQYQGVALDRAYMQTQIGLHDWLLRAIDQALLPSAPRAVLRDLITQQRASVAAHLERARAIAP